MPALFVYILFGLTLAWRVLPSARWTVRCWLGLVFGLIALMWLPCLAAFFTGFTLKAQYIALGAAGAGTVCLALIRRKKPDRPKWKMPALPDISDRTGLVLSLFITVFCVYLLHTHVLLPHEDGSLWVGQSTYGDLAMHLGFVESLYQQGTFPPEYSIYPGQMESGLSWIGLFIALSPMLGFMGTVVGMIAAFDAIQAAGDISPTLVAGGIKVALLTTLMGLIAAVILQLFYNYIVAKIDSLVNEMEDTSIVLMDMLTAYKK